LRASGSPHRDQARELLRALLKGRPQHLYQGSLHLLDESVAWTEDCYRAPLEVFSERTPEAAVAWLAALRDPWISAALRHDPGHEVAAPSDSSIEDPMQASLDILLFLKDVALFEALDNQQLVEVAQLAEKVDLPASHTVCEQGDAPDYLYLVRKGKLIVKVGGVEVARLGRGECAGEMAVLADTERTATVVTAEPSQLLRFESNVFKDLLDTYPEIGRGLLKSLVRRLANAGPRKGARPATMTGMVWGPGGPPLPKREG
jgi:CRP/FNR family transcriptional regulator, cyclic AMP receptor protein